MSDEDASGIEDLIRREMLRKGEPGHAERLRRLRDSLDTERERARRERARSTPFVVRLSGDRRSSTYVWMAVGYATLGLTQMVVSVWTGRLWFAVVCGVWLLSGVIYALAWRAKSRPPHARP